MTGPCRDSQLGAVVLAAGRGSRMGMPKLRLLWEGKSFLQLILDALQQAEIAPVVTVVAANDEPWTRQHADRTEIVINPQPQLGMMSSIQWGIQHLRHCHGLCLVPVDHPLVAVDTFRALKQASGQNPGRIIKLSHHQQGGHPIVIPHRYFGKVLAAAPDSSLRQLLRTAESDIFRLEVEDAAILRNINTWKDVVPDIEIDPGE